MIDKYSKLLEELFNINTIDWSNIYILDYTPTFNIRYNNEYISLQTLITEREPIISKPHIMSILSFHDGYE